MNVSLTPHLEALIRDKVRSGLYHSASEVVREGLRLLQENDHLRQLRLDELRREIAIGVKQADCGDTRPLDMQAIKSKARSASEGRR